MGKFFFILNPWSEIVHGSGFSGRTSPMWSFFTMEVDIVKETTGLELKEKRFGKEKDHIR